MLPAMIDVLERVERRPPPHRVLPSAALAARRTTARRGSNASTSASWRTRRSWSRGAHGGGVQGSRLRRDLDVSISEKVYESDGRFWEFGVRLWVP